MSAFATLLIAWQKRHGRTGLPWQGTRDPYRVWLSEVMLQQTQVAAVVPYYERFLARFPTVQSLAAADLDEVLQLWSGLGYYARGRNLHLASQKVVSLGGFPKTAEKLCELPGVGRSTAAAIAAFAFGERAAILDGNVKRVLSRQDGIGNEEALWEKAVSLLPKRDIETYTQALMDLGATVCTRKPRCELCPVRRSCVARKTGRIEEFPVRPPRKSLPQRSATWYVVRHAGRLLLEQRPPSGIWGGLWTFPEARPGGVEISCEENLTPIEHGFTHFRLRIQPLLCEARALPRGGQESARAWLTVEEALAAAVPTPVRRLLAVLGSGAGAPRRRQARAGAASRRAAAAAPRRAGRLPRR